MLPLETTLLHLLLDAAVALVCGLAGVQGGTFLQRRRMQLQLDLLADEVDALSRRLARRDGQAGRAKKEENAEKGEAEASALLQQLGAGGKRPPRLQPPAPVRDLAKRAHDVFDDDDEKASS